MQDKTVTIVHRDLKVLNAAYPDRFRLDLERRVRAFGIDLVLNDAVEKTPGRVSGVTTREGKTITDADLLVRSILPSHPHTLYH